MVRRAIIAVAFAVVLLGTGLAVWQFRTEGPYPTDGPLPVTAGVQITFELDVGEPATWGTPLPGSDRGEAIVRRIEPIGVEGLDVLGIRVCHASREPNASGEYLHCAPVNDYGWPPSGVQTNAVEGTVLDASADPLIDMLIGLRRQPSTPEGRIESVRIVYTVNGVTYETIEPWSLRLVPRGALPSG